MEENILNKIGFHLSGGGQTVQDALESVFHRGRATRDAAGRQCLELGIDNFLLGKGQPRWFS